MATETYERTSTLTLLCAILSALWFEQAGSFAWLAGTIGILAAGVAAISYFRFHWSDFVPSEARQASNAPEALKSSSQATAKPIALTDPRRIEKLRSQVLRGAELNQIYVYMSARQRVYQRYFFEHRAHSKALPGPQLGNDRIIQIVQRLSVATTGPTFEFCISKEGDFTIRPVLRPKTGRDAAKGLPESVPPSVKPETEVVN